MTEILIIVDGMEDIKYKEINNKTPINFIGGFTGLKIINYINNTPNGFETDSLSCICKILGVEDKFIPKGRACLEAEVNNINIKNDDLIMRCNTVNVDKNFNIINMYTKKCNFENTDNIKVFHIGGYRNIMTVKNALQYFDSIKFSAPHQNIGKNIFSIMPYGNIVADEIKLFCNNFINKNNIGIVPWSKSYKQKMPSYFSIHKKNAVMICGADIVKGIAREMNIFCPDIKQATGDIDTNLKIKTKYAIDNIKKYDNIIIHINGADESSHRKNLTEKIQFLKRVNKEVIIPLLNTDLKITVMSDHATICKTGKHSNIKVAVYQN